jgi:myo-inositol 2-dehydrogenase / D-chiro-inositol 1-dehydrogenase
MTQTLRVGIIGGGLATQAIHLPTLARLDDRFRVVRIMDIDASTAANVAARCGAKAVASTDDMYRDSAVDVVAICSPHAFHAEQAIAACRAGKRLVLIEKPLAATREEALQIVRAARETGTRIIVGAMHVYDPAYRAARHAWTETRDEAQHVHSEIFLPTNDRFIDQATDRVPLQPPPPRPRSDPDDPTVQAGMLRAAILGLAIHDLPLIRSFVASVDTLVSARFVPPFGYEMSFAGGGRSVRLVALMPGAWEPRWTLKVIGRMHELHAALPPSYVLAGSSRCTIQAPGRTTAYERDESGYEAMWRHAHAVGIGSEQPQAALEEIVADLNYALDLADRVDGFLGVKP